MREEQGTGNKQILVVEDESLIAAGLQRRLERMGYSAPTVAHSGEEAQGYARKTRFDLDIRLQGPMDRIAAAHRLKHELQMPVVLYHSSRRPRNGRAGEIDRAVRVRDQAGGRCQPAQGGADRSLQG